MPCGPCGGGWLLDCRPPPHGPHGMGGHDRGKDGWGRRRLRHIGAWRGTGMQRDTVQGRGGFAVVAHLLYQAPVACPERDVISLRSKEIGQSSAPGTRSDDCDTCTLYTPCALHLL